MILVMGRKIRLKFAKRLRQLRKRKGWTQDELAEHSDLAVRQVQYLESKNPSPAKLDTIEKIVSALGIKWTAFFRHFDED